ncbi:MAG: biosis protein MshE [Pseudomonadota bacterium]|nr:biosis protein MshE [Pseudomonadota bacterium]
MTEPTQDRRVGDRRATDRRASNRPRKIRLGDLLVTQNAISPEQLEQALAEQQRTGGKLGRILIDSNFVTEDQMLEILSRQLAIQQIDLRSFQLRTDLVRRLPETMARRFRCVVLDERDGRYLVGMADPTDLFAFDEVSRVLHQPVTIALVREGDLRRVFDTVYRHTEEINEMAQELGQEIEANRFDINQLAVDQALPDAPVAKLLQTLFIDAVKARASDIHIEPDEQILRIRQRVDGLLQEQVMQEKRIAAAIVLRLKLMAGLNISEKRLPQDGRFNIRVDNRPLDVRLSTMPTEYGESVVMRLLDQSGGLLDLSVLGMTDDLVRRFTRILRQPNGLVLVTGPTGSGKTTTLYAALQLLNTKDRKIITVEDPVEYHLPRITQVQVNPRIGLDFATVLRSALRQDPDIVLVGEIRDQETAEIALRAAMTGHLVLSTLHTNDALSSAGRLLDMGVHGYLIASSLQAVLAQRLARKVCEFCAIRYYPTAQQQAWLNTVLGEPAQLEHLRYGRGCSQCHNTGYRGRFGVYEYLEPDRGFLDALRHSTTVGLHEAPARHRSLAQVAVDHALDGYTTLAEAQRIAGEMDDIEWVRPS